MEASEGLSWVDDRVVAVLGSAQVGEVGMIRLVTIGGRTETFPSPADSVALSARNGVGSISVLTSDGALHVRVNTVWSTVAMGSAVTGFAFSG